jgi:hypothetical protein
MKDFTDRVNAVLPLAPDPVLLALLQGHADIVCGNTCPAGEYLANNRCLPSALLASAARKTTSPATAPQGILMRSTTSPINAEPVASATPPAMAAAVPRARRRPTRHTNIGSLLFGIFRW